MHLLFLCRWRESKEIHRRLTFALTEEEEEQEEEMGIFGTETFQRETFPRSTQRILFQVQLLLYPGYIVKRLYSNSASFYLEESSAVEG